MKEKKKSTLSKLMVFAGNHKYYVYASCILATISAFMALVPFYDIWRIIKEVLEVRPHFNEAVHIKNYGGHAVLFALLSMIFYIVAHTGPSPPSSCARATPASMLSAASAVQP